MLGPENFLLPPPPPPISGILYVGQNGPPKNKNKSCSAATIPQQIIHIPNINVSLSKLVLSA
jgi:hypothetical protein